jgi:DNA-binding transcriptional ArsR family regulator
MSPHTNTCTSAWDPSRLRLGHEAVRSAATTNRRARRCSAISGQFIAGPVDVAWVLRASRLGVKALLVGLLLWHLKGLRRSVTVLVSNLMAVKWGITPDAKGRALRKLEKAGLIAVERQGKRSPRVTLLVEASNGATNHRSTRSLTTEVPIATLAAAQGAHQ